MTVSIIFETFHIQRALFVGTNTEFIPDFRQIHLVQKSVLSPKNILFLEIKQNYVTIVINKKKKKKIFALCVNLGSSGAVGSTFFK